MLANVTTWLLDPSGLTPHGFCLLWQPGLIWLHAISDIAIAVAYFTIPMALGIFARSRRDLVFKPVFWLFATFILLCGTTHWLSVLTLFVPAYGLEGIVKAVTALVSVVTAVALWPLLPKALALPSAAQLSEVNAALQASEARLRNSFERSPVPMQVVDSNHRLMAVSDTWLQLLGYERAQVIGRSALEFQLAETEPTAERFDGDVRILDRRFVRRDGSIVETEVSSRFEREGGSAWSISVVVDISARRRAEAALRSSEERLHQAQKMDAVGQLTGGIAHDFNNMLQGMSGGLEMLERRIAQGKPDRLVEYLRTVRTSLDRAAGLTRRMLAFARKQTLQPRPTEVQLLIIGLEELLSRTLGPNITLKLRLEDHSRPALCDPNQLESALLNLAINARDAMPDGGTLEIVTTDRHIPAGEAAAAGEDAAPGDYVEIAVIDSGIGMPPEISARAFEPFFTTKPIGHGTGLGLSQLYGFVRQSGGFVRLDSQPGHGTTVTLLLPHSVDSVTAANEAPSAPAPLDEAAPQGTVLVVDDEPSVRFLVVERLRDLGLEVLEAADAATAAGHLQQCRSLALMITDVGMPGMNGRQLAENARENHPGLPVLLITGYAGDAVDDLPLPQGMELMYKPFALEALANRVLAALEFARVG